MVQRVLQCPRKRGTSSLCCVVMFYVFSACWVGKYLHGTWYDQMCIAIFVWTPLGFTAKGCGLIGSSSHVKGNSPRRPCLIGRSGVVCVSQVGRSHHGCICLLNFRSFCALRLKIRQEITPICVQQKGASRAMLLVVSHLGAPPSGRVSCEANYTAGGSEALSPNH